MRQRAVEPEEPEPVQAPRSRTPAPRPLVSNRAVAAGGPTDAFAVGRRTAARIAGARGGGSPLPQTSRDGLESATGQDLSGVRVHADAEADRLAKGVGAKAFTSGSDVFFRSGRYAPSTSAGGALLEHEIGHVVGPPASADVVLRDDDDDPGGGFGGDDEPAKAAAGEPTQLADDFPDDPVGARAEAVERIQGKMNEADAAGDKLLAARRERHFLLTKYTQVDRVFQSVEGVEEFVAETWEDSANEATVLKKLGPMSEWSLVMTPQAFPDTWADLVKQALDLGIDSATIQAQATDAWNNLLGWAAQVPPYVIQDGLPVDYAAALNMQKFEFSGSLASRDDGGAVRDYAKAAMRYRFTAYKAGFVGGWQQFVTNLVKNVKAGETVVDAGQIDDMAGASSKLGQMAKAAGPPGEDGYRELDTDLVNLQQAAFLVAFVAFFQSMTNSTILWKQAEDLFYQKMEEADAGIKGTGFMDNMGKGFWWAFAHGYFQGAIVATAMAIWEHKVEIFAKLTALAALLIAMQETPIGWIADLFGALVIAEAVYDLLAAFKAMGSSDTVVSLQRNSAKFARTFASSIENGVLAYVMGKGIEATAKAYKARMEKAEAAGASERAATREVLGQPKEELPTGAAKPGEAPVAPAAPGGGKPGAAPPPGRIEKPPGKEPEFLEAEPVYAGEGTLPRGGPQTTEFSLGMIRSAAKQSVSLDAVMMRVELAAGQGVGKWVRHVRERNQVHYLTREELVNVFGEQRGAALWAKNNKPNVSGLHADGHVFIKPGMTIDSAASTLVHELSHAIQRRYFQGMSDFMKEFQAFKMQRHYLERIPAAEVPPEDLWLLRATDAEIEAHIEKYYGFYSLPGNDNIDEALNQILTALGDTGW
jgi:hypothetical protein